MDLIRGSTWGKWDLHVHSPASFNWRGDRFGNLSEEQEAQTLINWVKAINDSDVVAFAIMDYWTFEGVFALRRFMRENPDTVKKTVFPGIELRIQAPTSYRLNVHVILSDKLTDQELRDFLAELKIQIIDGQLRSLSPEALRCYARSLREDVLQRHSKTQQQLQEDDVAWQFGCETAEVTLDSFKLALKSLPNDTAVVFQPWDTYHGLKEMKWWEHYTAAYQLFSQPDIFECKSEATRNAFIGRRTEANKDWFDGFWRALGERPRLPVRGSDAHKFNDYGKFQSDLPTWLKAAPTFHGLLQAIKEPAQRSFLGVRPPKLDRIHAKPSGFIDQLSLRKIDGHGLTNEDWFDGEKIKLNPDLVAVIGNKGTGKSALADIIALLGDTSNTDSFSFLTDIRFRDKKNNRSCEFEATLVWANKVPVTRQLNENPAPSAIERVRYVPQSFFERVCSGQSDSDLREFTNQIESVIFAHVPQDLRGDAEDLKELLERYEVETKRQVLTMRIELEKLNSDICELRRRTTERARKELVSLYELRQQELADLRTAEPPKIDPDTNSPDVNPKLELLNGLMIEKEHLDSSIQVAKEMLAAEQKKLQSVSRLLLGLSALSEHVSQEVKRLRPDAEVAELDIDSLVNFKIDEVLVKQRQSNLHSVIQELQKSISGDNPDSFSSKSKILDTKIAKAREELGSTQLAIQAAREQRVAWESEVEKLEAPPEIKTSIAYVEHLISIMDAAPEEIEKLTEQRNSVAKKIVEALLDICASREGILKSAKTTIDELLPPDPDFSLDFVNEMYVAELQPQFFQLIKQVSGTFRGESEGKRAFRDFVESCPLRTADEIIQLAIGLEQMLRKESKDSEVIEYNIDDLVRKGRTAEDVLNLLFGFEYLQPRFTLAHGGLPLTQLSPGQRGAMLLVFFLLVEASELPIILDQPEENLDNETIYSLLVPAIKRAKERRQIIMITHNANLAVCCDAEQVIHASYDRANRNKITYRSGPIENPEINGLVVDVLEGTRPAFDNRRTKYSLEGV